MYDNKGVWQDNEEDIEGNISEYYQTSFGSCSPSRKNVAVVLEVVSPVITDDMNMAVMKSYTKDEVWEALNHMKPNGMHAILYRGSGIPWR